MSPSPLADFLKEYWEECLIALVMLGMALGLVVVSLENKALKATVKNSVVTIKNYEDAAKDNLNTIEKLKTSNAAFAELAYKAMDAAEEQAKIVEVKDKEHAKSERTLRQQLEKAHAQNKEYSNAVVPAAVARRLRQNSGAD